MPHANNAEYDMHQVDKLGVSAVEELTRRKDRLKLHDQSSFFHFTMIVLKPY